MRNLAKSARALSMAAALWTTLWTPLVAAAEKDPLGKGLTIYVQMGGKAGDSTNISRERGVRDAAAALGVTVIEQNGGWDPQLMLDQAKQALAAQPDGIVIIGNQEPAAFTNFLKKTKEGGTVVIAQGGNLPGTGLSYFGGDDYGTGHILGEALVREGHLKKGDRAVVYGDFAQPAMLKIAQGTLDAFKAAGVAYDTLQWTREQVLDPSLVVPVLVSYLQQNPTIKAVAVPGHGGITAILGKALKDAGKAPGEVVAGGYDISPAALEALKTGYLTVIIDQQFYMQGFMAVTQAVLEKRFGIKNIVANTATGVVTKADVDTIAHLVEIGVR